MKKLILVLLFGVAATLILSSCDPSFFCYYELKNDTSEDVTFLIENMDEIVILSGERKKVYSHANTGGTHTRYWDISAIWGREIRINGKLILPNAWQEEHWTVRKRGKRNYGYTLNLTDEVLEYLLSVDSQ